MNYPSIVFLNFQKQATLDRSPRLLSSRLMSRLHSLNSRLSQNKGRGSTWASGSSYRSVPGGTGSFHQQLVLKPKGEPYRGRGRGVRLRGGGAGRGISGGGSHAELEEESEDTSSSSTNSSSSSDEEEEESGLNRTGGDKENQPQSRRGGTVTKEHDDEGSEVPSQNGAEDDEEEEMEQDIPKGDKDVSNLKVTLQKPPRAKQDSTAIVPKLEAVASQTAPSTTHSQSRTLIRPSIRTGPRPDQHPNKHTPPQTRSGHTYSHSSHPERLEATQRPRPTRPAKLSNGAASSSSSELQHLRIPLSALQEGGGEADRESAGSNPSCEREVWVSVFRYLSRADLCVCMAVCKNWYKW